MIPTTILVSLGIFAVAAASPFDPLTAHLGDDYQSTTPAQREAIEAAYDLDQHWLDAWWNWWVALFHGDLGWSSTQGQAVGEVIAQRLPFTIGMSAAALVSAALIAVVYRYARDELDGRDPEVAADGTRNRVAGDQEGTTLVTEEAPADADIPTGPATSG